MLHHTRLTKTAWKGEQQVSIARTLTDFSYLAELADLAGYQQQGIGKRLLAETSTRLGSECMVVLLAAPKANDYYPKLGFEHNPRAWVLRSD